MAKQLEIIHQEDGSSNLTPPLHINKLEHVPAKEFIEKWHYSGRMPTGKNVNYGLWVDGELYAVIVYGVGVNPYQDKFLGCKKSLEIKRMCRSEPKKDYYLSRFISLTIKFIKKIMYFDCVVAFADPEFNHEGTVYKAAGFEYMGETNPEFHLIDDAGNKRHRRYAYRYARRNNITIDQARKDLGLSRIKTKPKYRWVRQIKDIEPV